MKKFFQTIFGVFKRQPPIAENSTTSLSAKSQTTPVLPVSIPTPLPYEPFIDPAYGRKWLAAHIQLPTADEIQESKNFAARSARQSKLREMIPKSLRFPIIMHQWLESPEKSTAADSIEQAIEIFSTIEKIYTNCEKYDFDAKLGIVGNPAKTPSDVQFKWSRFKNIDGVGWQHELNSHYAYFYDNGGILVTRKKANIQGTLTIGPEFQKYGK